MCVSPAELYNSLSKLDPYVASPPCAGCVYVADLLIVKLLSRREPSCGISYW